VDSFLFDLDDKLRRNLSNTSLDADSKFTLFLDTFIDVINTHTPLVKLCRRKTKLASKPWISKGTLRSIKTKTVYSEGKLNIITMLNICKAIKNIIIS